jgi:hypothetical protein
MDGLQPETIIDRPVPLIGGTYTDPIGVDSSPSTTEAVTPTPVQDKMIPLKPIAVDVMSDTLDTQTKRIKGTFSFEQLGALLIGNFLQNVSGTVRISPDGIVATDKSGNTTFALDGTTGDATFKGTVEAGTFIAGATQVGDSHVIIDGLNARIIINDGTYDRVLIGYDPGGF